MSKHTPGPWNYGEGYIDTHAVDDDGSRDYIILAEMHSTFGPDNYGVDQWMLPPEECEANGRLMAAAPEMLKLIQALSTATSGGSEVSMKTLYGRLVCLRNEALRLLDKIGGGE